jgi:hypothetical protein
MDRVGAAIGLVVLSHLLGLLFGVGALESGIAGALPQTSGGDEGLAQRGFSQPASAGSDG